MRAGEAAAAEAAARARGRTASRCMSRKRFRCLGPAAGESHVQEAGESHVKEAGQSHVQQVSCGRVSCAGEFHVQDVIGRFMWRQRCMQGKALLACGGKCRGLSLACGGDSVPENALHAEESVASRVRVSGRETPLPSSVAPLPIPLVPPSCSSTQTITQRLP